MTDHRAEADRLMRKEEPYATEYLLAAIHDEQQAQTGLLTDLRGAVDDLAEALRPKGDPCPCGCRRDVEPLNPGEAWVEDHDAEPDTVTLPRGVVDVAWARLEVAASDPAANQESAARRRAAADALLAALAAATNPYRQEADDARD